MALTPTPRREVARERGHPAVVERLEALGAEQRAKKNRKRKEARGRGRSRLRARNKYEIRRCRQAMHALNKESKKRRSQQAEHRKHHQLEVPQPAAWRSAASSQVAAALALLAAYLMAQAALRGISVADGLHTHHNACVLAPARTCAR